MTDTQVRPPLPPFTLETAIEKVRLAEDGWNSRDAAKVALAYSLDTKWRNRAEFANNRVAGTALLSAMLTNGVMTRVTGSALMATKTGNLRPTA